MNREIKFRGKSVETEEWVYGDLIRLDNITLIAGRDMWAGEFKKNIVELNACSVYPESIGQYTGLKDKNGKEIFEGDILIGYHLGARKGDPDFVLFKEGAFQLKTTPGLLIDFVASLSEWEVEVIGNIHDNPEILKHIS